MSASKVFVARLANTPVYDLDGDRVGRLRDLIVNYRSTHAPRVSGILVELLGATRKLVFVQMKDVTAIGSSQLIVNWDENEQRPFEQRGEEVRVFSELLDRSGTLRETGVRGVIEDISIVEDDAGDWSVGQLYVRLPRTSLNPFGKAPTEYVTWDEIDLDLDPEGDTPATQFLTAHSEIGPSDLADALLDLPIDRRLDVVEELPDARLADVLEEMYEDDQVVIIQHLDENRAAGVLDHMQPDDAADLVGRLDANKSESLLALMEPEEAEDVRMLLEFEPNTAGGLMTTDPIVVSPDATVAEALVLIRRSEIAPALATAVFVTASPYEVPTGRYLGLVHFQRLLRYPPHERVGSILDKRIEPAHTTTKDVDVVRSLARYDLVALPVVDDEDRLVGVITVDDVLDHILPDDWRSVPTETYPETGIITLPTTDSGGAHG
ncbi:magnesium transporter MgtE N-terminal domain-containing protein [Gulosibacter molinativorax]|uniref:Magnesium transporter n=1 Tax=Gulosibacter molinativorax TaxID=256821 RepID=A0ABT7C5V1_9MICO|nr:CBS domain-containing protein [Gulosibacter molinativorax]MDJ1370571.1 magnesium transporter [Gulosibacter molinativorax]QUY62014.1 Magnesium transporter [Gulosibacter molinativorax]